MTPRAPIGRPRGKPSLEEVLLARIDKGDGSGCWLWTGGVNAQGYGRLFRRRGTRFAHRLAFQVWNGPLNPDDRVRHTCDNPPCCRPDHIVKGTQRQNLADMVKKRRHAHGENHPHAKLTTEAVMAIRKSRRTGAALAREYGVSESTTGLIRKRKSRRLG